MGRRTRRCPGRGERGAAAVEFALLLPLLLLLVFGIVQYGLYFWAVQGGSDIARSAARRAAVGDPATCATFQSGVRSDIDALTGTGTGASIKRSYATASDSGVQVGDTVTVEVSFDSFDLQLPFLPFVDDGRVSTTVETRVDFVPLQPQPCA